MLRRRALFLDQNLNQSLVLVFLSVVNECQNHPLKAAFRSARCFSPVFPRLWDVSHLKMMAEVSSCILEERREGADDTSDTFRLGPCPPTCSFKCEEQLN